VRTFEGLYDYWAAKTGHGPPRDEMQDRVLLDTLGLGNQQVFAKLHGERPDFAEFAQWMWETVGAPDPLLLDRYHNWLAGRAPGAAAQAQLDAIAAMPPVLDAAALSHWDELGYVILPDAINAEEIAAVTALLWQVIKASPDDPDSWTHAKTDGIMVPYFQHPALEAARQSPRIHKAFAQLWGRENLWVTIDRMGFNPPISCGRPFMGSALHWDVSLAPPIPFGTQAILYLTDTKADEGAFRCVPGFHRRIEDWLDGLGDTDPRGVDLSAETKYVEGRAGDLIIWHHALPHGASPNHGSKPRLAQYLTYYAPDMVVQGEWR
jgi:Phytanoyl-CoA dioxygenase (PhyH)